MSDMPSLVSQVQRLETSVDRWNSAVLWLTAATALVAAIYFGASYFASKRAGKLREVQSALLRAKDEQLARDLKERDLKIQEAKQRSEELARENLILAKATEEARARAEQARTQNLVTEAALEQEKLTRLELESALAPRVLIYREADPHKSLKPYAGTKVILQSVSDVEAQRAGMQIAQALAEAGWEVNGVNVQVGVILPDGVSVAPYEIPLEHPPRNPEAFRAYVEESRRNRSPKAAEALVDFLRGKGWEARVAYASNRDVPPNTIKITVGLRPGTYFLPRDIRQLVEDSKKVEESVRERLKKMRERYRQVFGAEPEW